MFFIDETDRQIIELLQQNAKLNIKELAEQLHITKTPIYERIKRLEREGIISQYVALVDKSKISPYIIVFCAVTLDVQKADFIAEFNSKIIEIPEVVECYLTGGVFDFILKVIVRDLQAYHEFATGKLATLPNVSQIQSSFVLTEVKHTTSFPLL